MKRLCFATIIALATPIAFSATIVWTNTTGGDWSTAASWSPNLVPGGVDTASIASAGIYTVTITSGAVALVGLDLGEASGTQTLVGGSPSALNITNVGTVGPNGVLIVSNGGLQGQLTVLSGGQLVLASPSTKNVSSLTLVNQGTVTWSGGQLYAGGTPTTAISNGGLWQITGDNVIS